MIMESDGKGFRRAFSLPEPFFCPITLKVRLKSMRKKIEKVVRPKKGKAEAIAFRKTCKAEGTGLSHYILMDKKK